MMNLNNNTYLNQGLSNGNSATLYVVTPRNIPQQVIRPYQYNFDENLVNLMAEETDIRYIFNPHSRAFHSEVLNQAIIPNMQGTPIDTSDFSMMWSFVLVIDQAKSPGSSYILPTNKNRTLVSGFFLDEPINPQTIHYTKPTPNMRALMLFTHISNVALNDYISPKLGSSEQLTITRDDDCISSFVDNVSSGDMYLMTPSAIRRVTHTGNDGESISTYGDNHVATLTENVVTTSRLNSPKHQFQDIVYALDSAMDHSIERGLRPSSSMVNEGYTDPLQDFMNVFDANIVTSNHFNPIAGIEVNKSMTLGQLDQIFPNLKVQPFEVPNTSRWDVRDQKELTIHNSMSSMIASTVGAIATGSGIGQISFRYTSKITTNVLEVGQKDAWEIKFVVTLVPANDGRRKGCIRAFTDSLKLNLWPILQTMGGDFDVIIHHDINGETLVSLQFHDFNKSYGWYETCNRLGGMSVPVVGDINSIINNSSELQCLMDSIAISSGIGDFIPSKPSKSITYNNSNNVQSFDNIDCDRLRLKGENKNDMLFNW